MENLFVTNSEKSPQVLQTNDLSNHVITAFWTPHEVLSVNETNIYSMEQKSKTDEQGNSLKVKVPYLSPLALETVWLFMVPKNCS